MNAIRAEYQTGNISIQKLADKYGIPYPTLRDRAKREKWREGIAIQRQKVIEKTLEKTAEATADNAVIAKQIQTLLLQQLLREAQNLPELIGTETHQDVTTLNYGDKDGASGKLTKRTDGGRRYKLTDLTRAYRDLTDDLPKTADAAMANAQFRLLADMINNPVPERDLDALMQEGGEG